MYLTTYQKKIKICVYKKFLKKIKPIKIVKNKIYVYKKNYKNKTKRNSKKQNVRIQKKIKKRVFHKSEEKMHKKLKMALQRAKNLVHVKRHYGDSICKEIFFLF